MVYATNITPFERVVGAIPKKSCIFCKNNNQKLLQNKK